MPRVKDPARHSQLAKDQVFLAYQLIKKEREDNGEKLRDLQIKAVTLEREQEALRKSLNALQVSVVDGSSTVGKYVGEDDGA